MIPGEPLENAYSTKLQKTNLGYHTNNRYDGFPPLMSDGRVITSSWQPEAVENERIMREAGIESNWKYRQYLTQNAKSIMQQNVKNAARDIDFQNQYSSDITSEFKQPLLFGDFNEKNIVSQDSDLKSLYLSREQLNAQKVAPAISQEQIQKYIQKNRIV